MDELIANWIRAVEAHTSAFTNKFSGEAYRLECRERLAAATKAMLRGSVEAPAIAARRTRLGLLQVE